MERIKLANAISWPNDIRISAAGKIGLYSIAAEGK